jgi:organic hydroperoxide reductase OsmC/OhrA
MSEHRYAVEVAWTGNTGRGTSGYRDYSRDHEITVDGRPPIPGSGDPAFRGVEGRYNPEEMLVAALSACHMLWYLHLCADAGVVVTSYVDVASGLMEADDDGLGQFVEVLLAPQVEVESEEMVQSATEIHDAANMRCFVARSVKFPVRHEPTVTVRESPSG